MYIVFDRDEAPHPRRRQSSMPYPARLLAAPAGIVVGAFPYTERSRKWRVGRKVTMITRGVSDLRGIRSLNTRPGPITESIGLLKLYQLAAEKDNVLKKLAWVKRQQDQAEKRLAEITRAMQALQQVLEEKARREPAWAAATLQPSKIVPAPSESCISTDNPHTGLRSTFITY